MIDYIIRPELELILIWNRGITSPAEIINQIHHLHRDPLFSCEFDSVYDVSSIEIDFTRQEILQMAHFAESLPKGKKTRKNAIIAPSNRAFGNSRMFELLTNGFTPVTTGVFRDWESALTWLGKDPASILNVLKAS
ncbi:hypothetical protein [Desulfoluna sp.]|uniref:hypothetical protein n=1 Tax=Desulfoluna sp. TaxID=2045199 RepID=UPI0026375CE7|nr:hypothetical protein [Desulfoluna sp.]